MCPDPEQAYEKRKEKLLQEVATAGERIQALQQIRNAHREAFLLTDFEYEYKGEYYPAAANLARCHAGHLESEAGKELKVLEDAQELLYRRLEQVIRFREIADKFCRGMMSYEPCKAILHDQKAYQFNICQPDLKSVQCTCKDAFLSHSRPKCICCHEANLDLQTNQTEKTCYELSFSRKTGIFAFRQFTDNLMTSDFAFLHDPGTLPILFFFCFVYSILVLFGFLDRAIMVVRFICKECVAELWAMAKLREATVLRHKAAMKESIQSCMVRDWVPELSQAVVDYANDLLSITTCFKCHNV